MEYFAIIAFARSGSTWLSSSLGSHPHIASGGEIFNWTNPHWREWTKRGKSAELYLDYMKEIGAQRGNITTETKVCGYKILYYHATNMHPSLAVESANGESYHTTELNLDAITKNTKIIHLKRRRHLMSITSNMLVDNSKRDKIRGPYQNKYTDQNITIKSKTLENMHNKFKEKEKKWDYFDNVFKNHEKIEVWYEDMCLNPEKEHNTILEFLGVEKMPLRSGNKKQRTELLRDTIINYGEASQHLIKML